MKWHCEFSIIFQISREAIKLTSRYRVAAELTALAPLTLAAAPHFVELLNGSLNNFGVVGQNASLEVTSPCGFHPHSCARQVGAAYVAHCLVDNNDFEVVTALFDKP